MTPSERRIQIMTTLCRNRNMTIGNLAKLFEVGERTIRRDIEVLSLMYPIYTQNGRGGGVYVMDNYSIDRMYMSEEEIAVLKKVVNMPDSFLHENEISILTTMIREYTKPQRRCV